MVSLTSDCLLGNFFFFFNESWFYYVPMVSHCSTSIACSGWDVWFCCSNWKQNPSHVFAENSRMWGELLCVSKCQAHWAKEIYWSCSVLLIKDAIMCFFQNPSAIVLIWSRVYIGLFPIRHTVFLSKDFGTCF